MISSNDFSENITAAGDKPADAAQDAHTSDAFRAESAAHLDFISHLMHYSGSDSGAGQNTGSGAKRTRRRGAIRSKSMFFRLFRYFVCFTITIMIILWLLQILFLQTFYQQMKIHELYNIANKIEDSYGDSNSSLYSMISNLTLRSDIYIQIEYGSQTLYASTTYPGDRMTMFASFYDTGYLKQQLANSDTSSVVVHEKMRDTDNDSDAMVYASVLDTDSSGQDVYLFIFTPLTAVGSTINILAQMLVIVTIISIIFGMAMSFFISRRLSHPINNITKEAENLAKGNYDANFDGTGYTETEELAASLNYAAAELSKADKLQKDLIANVSHDLKTPLTMVKSYAEMIRDISGNNPVKRDKHLQVIVNESDRLNDLVNDLVQLSKMQANVDALVPVRLDLEQIARESLDSFSLHTEKDGFRFDLIVEGDATVEADEKKIRQVFANLIGNAIRYSSDDKYVAVRLTERENTVLCEVIDHGQGIAAEDQDSVWDRYYRSSSNHSRTQQGTGLGLSIVKQIFVLHHAEFGVHSSEHEGSDFWFELRKKFDK